MLNFHSEHVKRAARNWREWRRKGEDKKHGDMAFQYMKSDIVAELQRMVHKDFTDFTEVGEGAFMKRNPDNY